MKIFISGDYENLDEERRPWNDKAVMPKIINGREDDKRCNKPWDYFYYHINERIKRG